MGHVHHRHAFESLNPLVPEGLTVLSRRNLLKSSLAGMAGISLPGLLRQKAYANRTGGSSPTGKSIILLWMTGGPSHIDTLDPKPDRPIENRGPFGTISTKLPGVRVCEYLPKLAGMLDRFTVIRSVDARGSNHEPNTVFQTANRTAEPRENREASLYPAIASVVAKHHGANQPGMPPYVAFMKSRSHLAFGGYLGKAYDPFIADTAAKLPLVDVVGKLTGRNSQGDIFRLAKGLSYERMQDRRSLASQFDSLRRDLDTNGSMALMDRYEQEAVDMLVGGRMQAAFDLSKEPQSVRDRYGSHLWCQQALIARRLVEAGSTFVTLDLSYHPASGTWDTHGDNIPPYGGIWNGLRPLLPTFDHLVTTLVEDLDQRGQLDRTLVIAMGEFGRTPQTGTQASSDGRNHWPVVMSMLMAGGGLRHGQVIGATEKDGGHILERPVTPGDLAATMYRYFGMPLDLTYLDNTGRPRMVLDHGEPLREMW